MPRLVSLALALLLMQTAAQAADATSTTVIPQAAIEKAGELRERIGVRLRDAKERLADAEAAIVDKTKAAARATDDFVHEQPWKAVGVAAALGLALGVLIGRR